MIKDTKKTKYVLYGLKKGQSRLFIHSSIQSWSKAEAKAKELLDSGEYEEVQIFRASQIKTFKKID